MLKHIAKHNDRKAVILYRQVPNEDHMCLVVYSDLLPRVIHDEVMKCLESPVGQQADNLSEALFRQIMSDGRNPLEVLHKEGFMKKVQTSQVIVTPTPQSQIRLDELNNLLNEMSKGKDAIERLAEMDKNLGMQTKKRDNTPPQRPKQARPERVREVGAPRGSRGEAAELPPLQAGPDSVLSDADIAKQQASQAVRFRAEAKSLLAEADRLEKEAANMLAPVVTAKTKATKNVATKKTSTKKAKAAKV